jgi:hypothetical protein
VIGLVTPWTPVALLVALAALIYLLRRRLREPWLSILTGAGLAAVAAVLALLRLSPSSAPAGFPWPPILGTPSQWAADPELFAFAVVLFLLVSGAAVARETSLEKLVSPLLLAAATFLFLFVENVLALALAWLLLEALLLGLTGRSPANANGRRGDLNAFWGFAALAGIVFAWRATGGATLRSYGADQWSLQARVILLAAVFVRLGLYPLTSRRLAPSEDTLEPLDTFAVFPVLAGLALAMRLAMLGPTPYPRFLTWLGVGSSLICGFLAWNSTSAPRRVHWVLRSSLGLVLLLWGIDAVPPQFLFPAAAASIGLGFGLWMLRPPEPSPTGPLRLRIWWFIVWGAPAVLLGLGPLAPTAYAMVQLWQHLLESSLLIPLILGLAAQMLIIAAVLRTFPLGETVGVHEDQGWSMIGLWSAAGLALTVYPAGIAWLGGYDWQEVIAGFHLSPSPGIWAAMVLPLLGAIVLPKPSVLDPYWKSIPDALQRFFSLGWLHYLLSAGARAIGRGLQAIEEVLSEAGYLAWTLAFLIGLALILSRG